MTNGSVQSWSPWSTCDYVGPKRVMIVLKNRHDNDWSWPHWSSPFKIKVPRRCCSSRSDSWLQIHPAFQTPSGWSSTGVSWCFLLLLDQLLPSVNRVVLNNWLTVHSGSFDSWDVMRLPKRPETRWIFHDFLTAKWHIFVFLHWCCSILQSQGAQALGQM